VTEIRLLDYSFSHPTVQQVKASGAVGVLRYLTRSSSAKRLTAVEARQLRAAGLWVGVVFEDGATRAISGRQAGYDDAVYAAAQAKAIGIPVTCPLFFAVDDDLDPARVKAYFEGVRSAKIPNPAGPYGSFRIVEALLDWSLADYAWQTVAWSGGNVSKRAHLYQRNSSKQPVAGTDENVLLRHLPLWGAPVTLIDKTTPPPPAPPPSKPLPDWVPSWYSHVVQPGDHDQSVASALKVWDDPAYPWQQVTLDAHVQGLFAQIQRVTGEPVTGALTARTAYSIQHWTHAAA
jgi:hypothetical protein